MYQSVKKKFAEFSAKFEGCFRNPYLDILGIATVAEGCRCDTPALWLALPWVMPDGSPAPAAEVSRQMEALIARQDLKTYRAGSPEVVAMTTIRLTDAGIAQVVYQRLALNEPYMRKAFRQWDVWPADAQLFALSLCWAVGAGWPAKFPNCVALLNAGNFLAAILHAPDGAHPGQYLAAAADMNANGNAGLVPRNANNELALSNAALVIQRGLPLDILYWPGTPLLEAA